MFSRHGRPRHFLPGKWRCRRFLGGVNSRRNCTRNPIVAGRSTPLQGRIKLVSEPGLVRIACGICIGRVGFGSSRCSEGLLGRYGHWGSNQRPWAEVADGTSTSRARAGLCFRSQRALGVPCVAFVWPAPYLHGVCADHAQPPIPVPNPCRARLARPPVSRYPRWQRRSGVVLDLPFS